MGVKKKENEGQKDDAGIQDLCKALEPFAMMGMEGENEDPDLNSIVVCCRGDHAITYGDLARARATLITHLTYQQRRKLKL